MDDARASPMAPPSSRPPQHVSSPLRQQQQQHQHQQLPPHTQQRMSPAATFQQLPPQQQQQQQQAAQTPAGQSQEEDGLDRARAYKSRNKRPCDFCRYKKAACHLESKPPCELCIRYNKDCTFVESPAKRRRPNDSQHDDNGLAAIKRQVNGGGGGAFEPRSLSITSMPGAFVNGDGHGMDVHHELLTWETAMPQFQMSGMGIGGAVGGGDFGPFDPMLYQDASMSFEPFDPLSASTTASHFDGSLPATFPPHSSSQTSPSATSAATLPLNLQLPFETTKGEPSLDMQTSSNAQIVGLSGESDPYLIARYRYDASNEATFQQIRMRKMNAGPPSDSGSSTSGVPAFFTIQNNALASKAQPPERNDVLEQYRRDVEEMVSDDVGKRLIRLFYKYIQPYFPILSREYGHRQDHAAGDICDPSAIPTCILAAIYGHALPFLPWDEKLCVEVYTPPSADAMFRIAWLACLPNLHTPNLAVLQTLLLLVQRRPTNKHVSDTPFKWIMMTTAVSVAQALGINRDPSDWSTLPLWEIKLRRRLAWATFVQDKWLALNFGRSTHIVADDWDVTMLRPEDFEDQDRSPPADPTTADEPDKCLHFIKLCELSLIVDDLLRNLFSLRACRALHSESVYATLDIAKPLRVRLTEWHQHLPAGILTEGSTSMNARAAFSPSPDRRRRSSTQHELNGNGSLQLAYITAKIELFRAMLRPRVADGTAVAVTSLRSGALSLAKEMFEFLDDLEAKELEAFWASYSRTNFTIATSFMLLLFVSAPALHDAKECLSLLHSWRSLLRVKSRSCDLLNLALLRLDGVFVAGLEKLIELSPAAAQAWAESGRDRGVDESKVPKTE